MILAEFDEEKFAKSLFEQGKAEGKAEGKDEGTEETRIQVVIRMIQNNYSDDSIQSIVPTYSLEEIQKLREDFQRNPVKYLKSLN